MTESQIIEEVWKCFQSVLGKGAFRLFLFGSRAKGNPSSFSDFDFIVLGKKNIPHSLFIEFKSRVRMIKTLYTIDLVDFRRAALDFQTIAKKTMKEIVGGQIRS